jgi:predicted permease
VNVIFGLMVVILAIACANVANLMLTRGGSRRREFAVRMAIGAGRRGLIRQLMTENLLIALAAGVVGLVFAQAATQFFSTLVLEGDAPIRFAFEIDRRVLGFTFLLSVLSAFLFGLLPAIAASKTDLISAIKSGETESGPKPLRARYTLVTLQVTGSLLMLMTAAQMYFSTMRVLSENPGFDRDRRLTVRLDPSLAGYAPAQTEAFYNALVEGAKKLPGIRSAALSDTMVLTTDMAITRIAPEGVDLPQGRRSVDVLQSLVDENYFSTLAVPVVSGRSFSASDDRNSPHVAMVNRTFADRFFNGNAIGKRVRLDDVDGQFAEIVGVTETGRYGVITESPRPYLYLPLRQNPKSRATLIVETANDPAAAARPIRDLIYSLDPAMPVFAVRTLEDIFQNGPVAQIRIFDSIFGVSALMGFVLAVIGLYAVVAFQVSRRTKEIGIRMALGAVRGQVMRMVLRQALLMTGIGIGAGLLLSMALRPLLLASLGRPGVVFRRGDRRFHSAQHGCNRARGLGDPCAPRGFD